MNVEQFTSEFRYEADGRLDTWRILDEGQSGDCDDFAATVAYLEAGSLFKFWLGVLTFRFWFSWCLSPNGNPHVILWVRGKGWIDNFFPEYRPKPDGHTRRIYMPFPIVVVKMALGLFR